MREREARLTSRRATSALELRHARCRFGRIVASIIRVVSAKATSSAERDVVRTGDALIAPRHRVVCLELSVYGC